MADGRIEAHNNAAERALRAVAIGRKNYLHLGSDTGGASAAVFYTLIGTAKLNAIEPQAYLRYVLERIGEHPINRIDELLPWVVAERMGANARARLLDGHTERDVMNAVKALYQGLLAAPTTERLA